MKNGVLIGLVAVGLGLAATGKTFAEGDPAAGRWKASTCLGCHGVTSYDNAYPNYSVPKLGGQHADYIVAALQAYQTGARKHATMHANASGLNEQDMQDIAAYFAGQGEPAQ